LPEQLPDVDASVIEIVEHATPFTMTSPQRIVALCDAVKYIQQSQIDGAIVECGVWKGGSMFAAIRTLQNLNCNDRQLWLYDTFDGMTEPTANDVDFLGRAARNLLQHEDRDDPTSIWCCSQLDQVKTLLGGTGYCPELLKFVVGPVEDTIPESMPQQIALLRLDTDWYESTKHELVHLMPRLAPGGVLIIDDYGHWEGCRRAVDEYFSEHNISMFLNRIDYTGRIGIHHPQLTTISERRGGGLK